METSAGEIGMREAEGRRGKGRSRRKKGGTREGKKEKTEKGENNRSKESSGGVGDMG